MISLDPWSARYGLEAASLAPFAGEPFARETSQPETATETERASERRWGHEAPGGGFREPEAMPIAEAEEGVPFVSEAERVLEATEAEGEVTLQWGEPARPETKIAPENATESGAGGSESSEAAEPQPLAEPERGEPPHLSAVSTDLGNGELATTDAAPVEPVAAEHADAEPSQSEPAPAPASRPAEDVLMVTEKPANPRRGWWRRATRP